MEHGAENRCSMLYLLLLVSVHLSEAADVYLSSSCGQTINIGRSGGSLDSQSSLTYSSGLDCQLVLEAEYDRQILLTFKEFDVEGGGSDCYSRDYLAIYDGSSRLKPTPDLGVFCGSLDDTRNVVSTSNSLRLRFRTDGSLDMRGFLLAYTAFDASGDCDWGELKCTNDRCIDIDLQYDGFNNCGDNNDEGTFVSYEPMSPGIILVIIIVCLVCLVLFGVSCACIWQRVCKSTPRDNTQAEGETGVNANQPTNNQQASLAMQPTGQPDKSNSNPGQPGPYPSQPSPYLGQPGSYPAQPTHNPGQPIQYPGQPVQYPSQPGQYPNQPGQYPNQLGPNPNQPGPNPNQLGQYPNQPGQYPNQPGQYPNQPGQYPNQAVQYPGQQYAGQPPPPYSGNPAPNTGQPVPSQPAPNSSQPAPNSSQPAPNSSQLAPNSSQPAPNSSQPAPNPQDPGPTAEQPTANTQKPTDSGENETDET